MARIDLGLSDDEFWSLSPKEFDAMAKRHQHVETMRNYRAGLAAAAIYNVNRKPHSDPIDPLMFFGGEHQPEPMAATAEQLAAGIDSTLRQAQAVFGGTDGIAR